MIVLFIIASPILTSILGAIWVFSIHMLSNNNRFCYCLFIVLTLLFRIKWKLVSESGPLSYLTVSKVLSSPCFLFQPTHSHCVRVLKSSGLLYKGWFASSPTHPVSCSVQIDFRQPCFPQGIHSNAEIPP